MNEDNEVYRLTPKGLLGDDIYDRLCLYMYRINHNGIALDNGTLYFVKIEKEEKVSRERYALDSKTEKLLGEKVIGALSSPEVMSQQVFKDKMKLKTVRAGNVNPVKDVFFQPKGAVSRVEFDSSISDSTTLILELRLFVF